MKEKIVNIDVGKYYQMSNESYEKFLSDPFELIYRNSTYNNLGEEIHWVEIYKVNKNIKYLGCATAAKNLFNELSKKNEISWNDKSFDYDLAHFHTFGPRSMLYAKRFKGKKIISAHSTPNLNVGNIAFPRVVNWLYIPIYNRFDHIIAVSEKCKKELIDLNCKPGISTIYNGIFLITKKYTPYIMALIQIK